MNWYAMLLDGRMRQQEVIREAEGRRRIAQSRREDATEAASLRLTPAAVGSSTRPLQLLWRRILGLEAR